MHYGYICVQAELAKSAQAAAQAKLSKAEEAAASAAQKLKVHPASSPICLDSLPFTAAIDTCSFRSGSPFPHDQGHAEHMGWGLELNAPEGGERSLSGRSLQDTRQSCGGVGISHGFMDNMCV